MRKFLYGLLVSVCMLMLSGVSFADTSVDVGVAAGDTPAFSVDLLTFNDPTDTVALPTKTYTQFDHRTSWRMPVLAVKPLTWVPNYQLRNYRRASNRGSTQACGYSDTYSHPDPRIPIAV